MSDRKHTPDVLADLLGAGAESPEVSSTPSKLPRTSAPRRAASPQQSDPARSAERTQRWEHLVASFQDYRGWRPRYENGVELPGWTRGPHLQTYLAEKGSGGWELAAASSGKPLFGVADCYQLFFKRAVR